MKGQQLSSGLVEDLLQEQEIECFGVGAHCSVVKIMMFVCLTPSAWKSECQRLYKELVL